MIATNGRVSLVAGPVSGRRRPGRRPPVLAFSLRRPGGRVRLYPFVTEPWQAFGAAAIDRLGNGGFWPEPVDPDRGADAPRPRHSLRDAARGDEPRHRARGARGRPDRDDRSPGSFTVLFLLDAVDVPRLSRRRARIRPRPAREAAGARGAGQLSRRAPPPRLRRRARAQLALHLRRDGAASRSCRPTRRTWPV